jgi:transketolase
MREIISNFLTKKAMQDSNFFVLSGDHGYALFDEIRKHKPEQFINVGVSEQAMIGYSAGMTKEGLRTVVYGLSAFIPIRVFEFIKMDICYEDLPVIILGDGAGLVYSTLGPSHQCAEDIACMRTLQNMNIYSPADSFEMEACLEQAFNNDTPSYIRIGKADKSIIHKSKIDLSKNSLIKVRESKSKIAIIATGSMVSTALAISDQYGPEVYSAPQISNLEIPSIINILNQYETIITCEEHSINGGLGSMICEINSENGLNKKIHRIGIKNRFTKKCGSYEYAIKEHGLDVQGIIAQLKSINVLL